MSRYRDNKAWRLRYPQKRLRQTYRYYDRTLPEEARKGRQLWTVEADRLVIERDGLTDTEIARRLGRTLRAVQHRRHRLRRAAGDC